MKTTKTALLASLLFLFTDCQNSKQESHTMNQLLEVDREFSKMSADKGVAFAFDFYMAENATIFRDGMFPVEGRESINQLFADTPENASLLWEPDFADIASSGDLGYTIGHWTYSAPDSNGVMQSSRGNYITIWKKQSDGSWKYVFDTGSNAPAEVE